MRTFTLKGLFLTTVFMLLGCLSIHAADDLITEQVVVKLDEAGTLPDKISEKDKYKITNLKIIGEINGTDLRLIREMAGNDSEGNETNGKLVILDLSEAKIVKGGDYYYSHYNYPNGKEEIYTSDDVIGNYAFLCCSSLVNISLPSDIVEIGNDAFVDCRSLISINIPSSVIKIGNDAFGECACLTNINLPSGITNIGRNTFNGCSSLTSINLPSDVTEIGDYAFCDCSSLNDITLPSGLIKIGEWGFFGCSSLTSITIPFGVSEIGMASFGQCNRLININLPSGVTKIGKGAFVGCSSLTSISIPSGVTEICEDSFGGCSSLPNINLPSGVTKIGNGAFGGCSSLTSISIPFGVIEIGDDAFNGCSSLTSINIPSSVVYLGQYAFGDYSCSLLNLFVNWKTPVEVEMWYTSFNSIDKESCTLYVPQGTYQDYKSASFWGEFEHIVEYDATGINHVTTSDEAKEISRYSVNGQRLDAPAKGLNIVKYSDGSVKKVVVQ